MANHETDTLTRRKHHKVFTGCENCKRRRVKCDEAQPACQRCQKARLVCVGYNPPKARVFELARRPNSGPSETVTSHRTLQEAGRAGAADRLNKTFLSMTLARGPNLRIAWQKALLDSFITIWLPDSLIREYTCEKNPNSVVPMSSWPSTAWKLAREKNESFVAHSLLCLTLVVLGSRTKNHNLIGEAAQHYARVLHQFQIQVSLLVESGYSRRQDDHVASLAAAGFICSQVEYILESWINGDRHLQGMASLLQACGPICLEHDDNSKIFYDHRLLWISCSVTHRKPTIYSQWRPLDVDRSDIASLCGEPMQELFAIAERIPALLQEFDTSHEYLDAQLIDLMQRLMQVIVDLDGLNLPSRIVGAQSKLDDRDNPDAVTESRLSFHLLPTEITTGYRSAFVSHTLVTAWSLLRNMTDDAQDGILHHDINEDKLRRLCESQVAQLRCSISEFMSERYGMVTASPLLFFVDSAWIAYTTLEEYCNCDLSDAISWFNDIGNRLASTGYRPLREPWLLR